MFDYQENLIAGVFFSNLSKVLYLLISCLVLLCDQNSFVQSKMVLV